VTFRQFLAGQAEADSTGASPEWSCGSCDSSLVALRPSFSPALFSFAQALLRCRQIFAHQFSRIPLRKAFFPRLWSANGLV